MKLLKITSAVAVLLFVGNMAMAAEFIPGNYEMQADAMQMKISFMKLPNGRLAVNGNGKSAAGSNCRIGDLGTVQGNTLQFGTCSVPIVITEGGFDIQASPSCIQCQPGASIQGSYKLIK